MKLLLEELNLAKLEQLTLLIEKAGGINHLSKMLDLEYSKVHGWEVRKQISPAGARMVEKHETLGKFFKAKDLRPDKF